MALARTVKSAQKPSILQLHINIIVTQLKKKHSDS